MGTDISDGFYAFGGPKNNKSAYGYGVFVPKDFEIDQATFNRQGALQVIYKDKVSNVSFSYVTRKGHTDAITYLHRDLAGDAMKGIALTDIESTKEDWTLPMIGREQTEFASGTYAKAHYENGAKGQKFFGDIFVYWFDQPELKANGVGLVVEYLAKEDDYLALLQEFDLVRKSYFRLPSYDDMNARVMFSEGKIKSVMDAARDDCDTRLLQIQGGQMPFAGWETILTKYTPAYDDEDGSFLVLQEKTPSGYLGHPKRQGMTVKPGIPPSALAYLKAWQ